MLCADTIADAPLRAPCLPMSSCYWFYATPDGVTTPEDMYFQCYSAGHPDYGAQAASFRDLAEFDFMVGLATTTYVLLGGSDHREEGKFVWWDGTDFTYADTKWASNEPSNLEGGTLDSQELVELNTANSNINDISFDLTGRGMDFGVMCYTSALCPLGYAMSHLGDRCIDVRRGDGGTKWHEARSVCAAHGATLATARSAGELSMISFMGGADHVPWLNYNDLETEGVYRWGDDGAERSHFGKGSAGTAGWDEGEPNNFGGDEDCADVVVWSAENGPGLLNDADCVDTAWGDDDIVAACMIPYAHCPAGWHLNPRGDRCYTGIANTGSQSAVELYNACVNEGPRGYGAVVASIRDDAENEFAETIVDDGFTYLVIGGRDTETEDEWVWADGFPFSYHAWETGSGEPNDVNGEDRSEIRTSGLWNDIGDANTASTRGVMCYFSVLCPPGYAMSPLGDRCFGILRPGGATNYADAEAACAARGDRLARPRSLGEQRLLHAMAGDGTVVWLGLRDDQSEGTWVWDDTGTTLGSGGTFAPEWGVSEPLNSVGDEDCAVLGYDSASGDGTMSAISCTDTTDGGDNVYAACYSNGEWPRHC